MTPEELDNAFIYHPPSPKQVELYTQLREQGKALAETVMANCPNSRERSLAITKLREAIMWANSSIACYLGDSESPGA